ncbi:SIS domain-containing protein [Melghirimyces profundicolus]|nr:SIS domain-containing protein [Melghirimyces profundicolus]
MIERFFAKIESLLRETLESDKDLIRKAAERVAGSIRKGGLIHLFGCGHSHLLTEEVFYRAGGLVPVHPILHEPLMLHEGALRSSELERQNHYAERFMKHEDIRKEDVVIVISTSGRNPVPIDVAQIAKDQGAYVIGITSSAYAQETSRHQSGKLLYQCVDLAIDNHVPKGDALLEHPEVNVPFGSASTITGAAILQGMFAEAIQMLSEQGITPPVLLSGNIEGADEHNRRLVSQYKERIPNFR